MSEAAVGRLGPAGARLWVALMAQDDTLTEPGNPLREVALEACRAADRCDRLDDICRRVPATVIDKRGRPVTHPAWTEARQHTLALMRLLVGLRLPDSVTGRRPQRRGARGAYRPASHWNA